MAVPGPRLALAGHDLGLALGQACLGAELVGLVGALPGEGVTAAPEVAVGRRRLVDRPAQVQVAQGELRAAPRLPDQSGTKFVARRSNRFAEFGTRGNCRRSAAV